jgi:hypothetical protein
MHGLVVIDREKTAEGSGLSVPNPLFSRASQLPPNRDHEDRDHQIRSPNPAAGDQNPSQSPVTTGGLS